MNANAGPLPELIERLERFYGLLPQPPREAFALYVWEVLSVHSTPARRDLAMAALRRIPALTPDSIALVPRVKLEEAVRHSGLYLEERMRALLAGAAAFRRNRRLEDQFRLPPAEADQALASLPYLSAASCQWMLLFAGDHPVVPADPGLMRAALRLGYGESGDDTIRAVVSAQEAIAAGLGSDLALFQQAALYLTHHGLTTCVEAGPHCQVCPLRDACPWPGANRGDQG